MTELFDFSNERNCEDCVFHDGNCTTWDCEYISRKTIKEKLAAQYQEGYFDGFKEGKETFKAERSDKEC